MTTSRPAPFLPAKRLVSLALLLCLAILLAVTLPPAAAQERPAVIGARAVVEPWSDPLEALGTLRADESVTLSATVTEIVAELNFRDGEVVEAGQLLIRLEDGEEQAQLRVAQALRDERRGNMERLTQLQSRNMAPRADVEDSQARLRQAEAEVQALEARLSNYRLRAPFSGRVGFRNISVGSLVSPGTQLVTLDKLDVMKRCRCASIRTSTRRWCRSKPLPRRLGGGSRDADHRGHRGPHRRHRGVEFIESSSRDGRSVITVRFRSTATSTPPPTTCATACSACCADLPDEADPPEVQKVDANEERDRLVEPGQRSFRCRN
jgi:multidrug efflux pump subunit AcrA (membrane-fusion protein)